MPSVYLDNAATTFPKPEEVYRAWKEKGKVIDINASKAD
jgi:selenocysteine lyase/cysteine desulfurase